MLSDNLNTSMYRKPDYSQNRFFISPYLGCPANCLYCYVQDSNKYKSAAHKNEFSSDETVKFLLEHQSFKTGKSGSIISIGAWGDPFSSLEATESTLLFLEKLCSLGNPMQICSKFTIDPKTINKIKGFVRYKKQLLFSTSIISFKHWKKIEPYAISPRKRIEMLGKIQQEGFPVNLMIKPFIFGITDIETDTFIDELSNTNIQYCVVGVFYWNDSIINMITNNINFSFNDFKDKSFKHTLMCNNKKFTSFNGGLLDIFCSSLRKCGIAVFKNASCVNAHLLKQPHVGQLFLNDPLNLCVKCGNCS